MKELIEKIKDSGLRGRSGGRFPTHLKWQAAFDVPAEKKYVICNASEGEPGVFKDRYILDHYPQEVISGIKLAINTISAKQAYIYLNPEYYPILKEYLDGLTQNLPIKIFKKPAGYLRGEETVLLNVIEGKPALPRQKPPFPTGFGLFNSPTLINNVETFWAVSQIAKNLYQKTRFLSINGAVKNKNVFQMPEDTTIKELLKQTNNWPDFDFFVQAGGGASGEILLPDELDQPLKGIGGLIVYDKKQTNPLSLMKNWARFYLENNCDKCAPCREGIFRINEILEKKTSISPITDKNDLDALNDIFDNLEKASFCPLGRISVVPFKSALTKLL